HRPTCFEQGSTEAAALITPSSHGDLKPVNINLFHRERDVSAIAPWPGSPLNVMHVLVEEATKPPSSSNTSHLTKPTVRPCLTTVPTAVNFAFQMCFRKLILSSSVVNDSPSPRFA